MSLYSIRWFDKIHRDDIKAIDVSYPNDQQQQQRIIIYSASRDGTVRETVIKDNDGELVEGRTIHSEHTAFVNSITSIHRPEDQELLLLSGGTDKVIYAWNVQTGRLAYTLIGHTDNVCWLDRGTATITGSTEPLVISGSWDGSARVWVGHECVYELSGIHSAAVWCAKALVERPNHFLTASADKTLVLWEADRAVRTYHGHSNCVRSIVLWGGTGHFYSAGNDGMIIQWHIDDPQPKLQWMAHEGSFIYSLARLSTSMLASVGEDRVIRIWDVTCKPPRCAQVIPVPAVSIWTVKAVKSDLFVGSSEGWLYWYSISEDQHSTEQLTVQSTAQSTEQSSVPSVAQRYKKRLEEMSITPNDLPETSALSNPTDQNLNEPGARLGQTRLVPAGNGAMDAYQWDGSAWVKIGQVVDGPTNPKKLVNGQPFDHSFDVDIAEGAPPLKLYFNQNDNPYMVADQFILRNDLTPDYRDQIVDFILKNTGKGGGASVISAEPKETETLSYYRAGVYNLDGIGKKLFEFAQVIQGKQCVDEGGDQLVDDLKGLLAGIASGSYDQATLKRVLVALLDWPQQYLFPVLDLVRVVLISKANTKAIPLAPLSTVLATISPNERVLALMRMRVLVNMFGWSSECDGVLADGALDNIALARDLGVTGLFKEPELLFGLLHNYALLHIDDLSLAEIIRETVRTVLDQLLQNYPSASEKSQQLADQTKDLIRSS